MKEVSIDNNIKLNSFLVTGGAGFIGSNIVRFLSNQGAKEIRVLDNFSTGKRDNIADLIISNKIVFIEGDIRDKKNCIDACHGIDIVLHQAALGSVQRSIIDPVTTNEVNVDGFLNMLMASKENKVKRFVYASSSSVYGDDSTMPKVEEKTGNLLSPYAISKKTNEEYAKVFSSLYGMEIIGLRYFNVFGPNQDVNGTYAAVIPLFIESMFANRHTVIYGDGENSRDFTFVQNVVQANMLSAFIELGENKNHTFNVAFGGTTSVNKLHKLLSKFIGNTILPTYLPVRNGDIRDSFADISKAKSILGYSPSIGLEEGLKITVDWWKKHLANKKK